MKTFLLMQIIFHFMPCGEKRTGKRAGHPLVAWRRHPPSGRGAGRRMGGLFWEGAGENEPKKRGWDFPCGPFPLLFLCVSCVLCGKTSGFPFTKKVKPQSVVVLLMPLSSLWLCVICQLLFSGLRSRSSPSSCAGRRGACTSAHEMTRVSPTTRPGNGD